MTNWSQQREVEKNVLQKNKFYKNHVKSNWGKKEKKRGFNIILYFGIKRVTRKNMFRTIKFIYENLICCFVALITL